jgi:3',5'-cyclic-AMP phosphodiesterase
VQVLTNTAVPSPNAEIRQLFRDGGVLPVEMGHTHYNELANDGRVIYAATRSTGQIEEGSAGFSVTTLDDGVVSCKFKPIGEWPFVMVTSPADERLIIDPCHPSQVVRGRVQVRARVCGRSIQRVTISVDGVEPGPMSKLDGSTWGREGDAGQLEDGPHELIVNAIVNARDADGHKAIDRIVVLVNRRALWPVRWTGLFRERTDCEGGWGLAGISD